MSPLLLLLPHPIRPQLERVASRLLEHEPEAILTHITFAPGDRLLGAVADALAPAFTRWMATQVDAELRLREQAVAAAGGDLRRAVQTLARQYPDGLPTGGR